MAAVATGSGGPINAALMAARILALSDPDLAERIDLDGRSFAEAVNAVLRGALVRDGEP